MRIKEELIAIIDRHAAAPRQKTPIAGLSIFKVEAPTLPVESIYTPRLCAVIQGQKEILLGGRAFEVDDTQYFIASVNLPVSARITAASTTIRIMHCHLNLTVGTWPNCFRMSRSALLRRTGRVYRSHDRLKTS